MCEFSRSCLTYCVCLVGVVYLAACVSLVGVVYLTVGFIIVVRSLSQFMCEICGELSDLLHVLVQWGVAYLAVFVSIAGKFPCCMCEYSQELSTLCVRV